MYEATPKARRNSMGYLLWASAVVEGCRGVYPDLDAAFDRVATEAWRELTATSEGRDEGITSRENR